MTTRGGLLLESRVWRRERRGHSTACRREPEDEQTLEQNDTPQETQGGGRGDGKGASPTSSDSDAEEEEEESEEEDEAQLLPDCPRPRNRLPLGA